MLISPAYAQAADSGGSMLMQLAPLVLIFVVFYFLLIRPQQRRMKEHQRMVADVKVRDTAITSGGLIGKVVHVDGNEIGLELAANVRVKALKGMVVEVRAKGEPVSGGEAKPAKPKEEGAFYKALGLKQDATAEAIEEAFAGRQGDAAAAEAHETLRDPVKRKLYDSLGHDEYVSRLKS